MAESDIALQKKQKAYTDAVRMKDGAITADDYNKAAEMFGKALGYEDAEAQRQSCLEQAQALRSQADTGESDTYAERLKQSLNERTSQERANVSAHNAEAQAQQKRQKLRKRILMCCAVVAIICIAGVMLYNFVLKDKFAYDEAVKLLEAGEYDQAYMAFSQLGTYGDSSDKLLEIQYIEAGNYLADGDYDSAGSIYQMLAYYYNYKDSGDRLYDAVYQKAKHQLETEDYAGAYETFTMLTTYLDSAELAKEAQYKDAVAKLDAGEYEAAFDTLTQLGDYADAGELISAAKTELYDEASILLSNGEYDSAANMFELISDYEDAGDMRQEALYQKAKSLYDAGDYDGAIAIYNTIADYSNVNEILTGDENIAQAILTEYRDTFNLGETVEFGADPETGTGVNWRMVAEDGTRRLLIADKCITTMAFDANDSADWADSSLNAWLNGDFYNTYFTAFQRSLIDAGAADTDASSGVLIKLMTADEAREYFTETQRKATDMNNQLIQYWLTDGGYYDNYVLVVGTDGKISSMGVVVTNDAIGVRPIMWIDLK